ncbi:MAG: hypothetical protein J6J36_02275 [Clostridia bacterium]|nr:hypothetical protein [Clostridia bacterium]
MDLKSLNAMDLSNANIGSFLQELENALQASRYSDVKSAIEQINSFLISPGIVKVGKDGKRMMEITDGSSTERIDIAQLSKDIRDRIQADVDNHSVSGTVLNDRNEILTEMDEFLTGIFNQQKLYDELISRGFSLDKFEDQAEKSNNESRARIQELKQEKNVKERAMESFLGKDAIVQPGVYTQKSSATRLRDCQEAITALSYAESKFNELKKAKHDKSVATTPEDIARLDAEIYTHEKSLVFLAKKIKGYNIPGIDPNMFIDWEKDSKISKANTNIGKAKIAANSELDKVYVELKTKVAAMNDSQKDELQISSTIEAELQKVDDSDDTIRKNARAIVDKYIKDIQMTVQYDIERKISMEKRLIQLREQNVAKFKDMNDKITELDSKSKVVIGEVREAKFLLDENGNKIKVMNPKTNTPYTDVNGNEVYAKTTYVQKLDRSGKPVYVDGEPQYEMITDANGNSIRKPNIKMVPGPGGALVPEIGPVKTLKLQIDDQGHAKYDWVFNFESLTDKTYKKELLTKSGFDDKKVRADIERKYAKRASKRKALRIMRCRGEKVGSKLGTLLFPGRQWKKYKAAEYILNERRERAIKQQQNADYVDSIPMRDSLSLLRLIYERVKNSAEIEQQLFSAGVDQGRKPNSVDKSAVIDALDDAAYEEAMYLGANEGASEIYDIRSKRMEVNNPSRAKLHEETIKSHVEGVQSEDRRIIHENEDDLEL